MGDLEKMVATIEGERTARERARDARDALARALDPREADSEPVLEPLEATVCAASLVNIARVAENLGSAQSAALGADLTRLANFARRRAEHHARLHGVKRALERADMAGVPAGEALGLANLIGPAPAAEALAFLRDNDLLATAGDGC